jgi:hypothetical protein
MVEFEKYSIRAPLQEISKSFYGILLKEGSFQKELHV